MEVFPLQKLAHLHSDGSMPRRGESLGSVDDVTSVSCMRSGEYMSSACRRSLTGGLPTCHDGSGTITHRSLAASAGLSAVRPVAAAAPAPPAGAPAAAASAGSPPSPPGQLQVHGNNQLRIFRLLGQGGYGTVFHGAARAATAATPTPHPMLTSDSSAVPRIAAPPRATTLTITNIAIRHHDVYHRPHLSPARQVPALNAARHLTAAVP